MSLKLKAYVIPIFLHEGIFHKDVRILYNPLDHTSPLPHPSAILDGIFYLEDTEIDRLDKEKAIIEFHGRNML